ncbi:hemolymph lipopolysaccharide-binding protein-like isoform X8 [Halictus rubicundus]|uniref:hemolymph lipopolysaccharide-binding protein-like isoform X8 n=1 Tax=Halictus rubicundus TaxID=77578 RepID=UPI004036CEC4
MRQLSLTSLAGVVLVVLFFEGGQASDVPLEALEIRNSNDQTNKSAESSDTLTINANNIYHAQQQTFYINPVPNTAVSWPHGCCANNFSRRDYVVTPGIGAHKFFKKEVTWNTARDICVRNGAQLAVINSDAEEALFRSWKSNNSLTGVWIGVHDFFQKNWWVTMTGEPLAAMSYDMWSYNLPDKTSNNRHCGVLWSIQKKGISHCPCHWNYSFVCEIDLC